MSQHLTAAERGIIESGLLQGNSFAYIGKKLDRSPTTISREVRKRRAIVARSKNIYNDCLLNSHCRRLNVCPDTGCQGKCRSCRIHDCTKYCKDYESCICTELDKPPYVCNGCVFEKTCKKDHAYYSAYKAQRAYEHELSASRNSNDQRNSPDRAKCIKEFDGFVEHMNVCIEKIKQTNTSYPACFGF